MARPLYEKYDFIHVNDLRVQTVEQAGNPSESEKAEWQKLQEQFLPIGLTSAMWRSKGGRYIEGVTVKPWE
jgi:hypothetical protein